jgi:hypothetical protein
MGWHRPKYVKTRWNDALSRTSWQDFERLLATHYARQGYRVEHVGTGNNAYATDGGIDLKLYRDDEYIVVQCKHWNVEQITHNPVHELIGVMHTQGATGAIIVTSGEFTRAAREAAAKVPVIELVDGQHVREMLGPVPEPATPYFDFGQVPTWAAAAASAANGPIGYHAKRYVKRHAKASANVILTKMVFGALAALVLPIVMISAFHAMWNNFSRDVIESTQRTQQRQPVITSAPVTASRMANVHGSRYVVTAPGSSTGSDTNPPVAVISKTERTKELKEWERQNAESMKILEKTTPELQTQ